MRDLLRSLVDLALAAVVLGTVLGFVALGVVLTKSHEASEVLVTESRAD